MLAPMTRNLVSILILIIFIRRAVQIQLFIVELFAHLWVFHVRHVVIILSIIGTLT